MLFYSSSMFPPNLNNPSETQDPLTRLKVFAPNGDTQEVVALLCIRRHPHHNQLTQLFLYHSEGDIEILNKKVVVTNVETGEVCYNPRTAPIHFEGRVFITGSEKYWLQKNPHWPAVLELCDNPVRPEEETDGLHP